MSETRKTLLLIAVLSAGAAAIFVTALPLAPQVTWLDAIVFFGLAALSESWYVGTSKESGMSLSFTVHFAAAVLFGPAFAIMIAAGGLVITDGFIRRAPPVRTAFNIAQMGVAVGLCGVVYAALSAPGPVNLVTDALALAAAAAVYLIVNDTMVAVVLSVHGRSFFQEWRLSYKDILLPYASMAPLGALAAYCYQSAPVSLLYFLPLVLVVYEGFKLFVSLQRETDHALVALADSIDRRDQYTSQHSVRVARYVEDTARALGLPPREVDLMVAAARVHDLGKISTDNRLLLKPTGLTPEERRVLESHAVEGDEIAGKFSMFHQGRRYIRHHHERWDGTGYPDGLSGTQIPLGARLINVADAYDAMTTDRPYRKAMSREAAVMELLHCAGTQFDPTAVRAFIEALDSTDADLSQSAMDGVEAQLRPWSPAEMTEALSERRDPAQLWASACLMLSRTVDVPDCEIYRAEKDGEFVCVASVADGVWYPASLGKRVDLALWSGGRTAVDGRTPMLVASPDDPRLSEQERADMLSWNTMSAAVVPLIIGDEVVGLVDLGETRVGRRITAAQVESADSLSRLIALAVHDIDVITDQRAHARRLASLLESSRAVASAKSTEDALAVVARRAVELFDLTSCIAYEYDREMDSIVALATWERISSGWERISEPLPLDEHPVERGLLESGQLRLETLSDPDLDPASRAAMERWGEKSCLTIPMQSVDGTMGLLTLWDSTRERRYTDDELSLATSLAELAGEAVRSSKLLRRLRGLSETDSLTGLANRRKLFDFLSLTLARAERYETPFSLLMLDIDGFKPLNDAHGHPAGDDVLRHVAALLKDNTRASDIVGRYGGDEFMLILPESTAYHGVALAEKLRAAFTSEPCTTHGGETLPVRASFGVAAYPGDGYDAVGLIAVADANLYASKRGGGDAVTETAGERRVPALAGG